MIDSPPDTPPQYTPIVIAQASQAKEAMQVDRTIGVCQLIENQPESRLSAINSMGPVEALQSYLWQEYKQASLSAAELNAARASIFQAKVSILQAPEHGELEFDQKTQSAGYFPANPTYFGADRATLLVEIGSYKAKVIYFFNIMPGVGGGTEGSDPYDHPENCPNGVFWKISLNTQHEP